jgi:hypothetical protein
MLTNSSYCNAQVGNETLMGAYQDICMGKLPLTQAQRAANITAAAKMEAAAEVR